MPCKWKLQHWICQQNAVHLRVLIINQILQIIYDLNEFDPHYVARFCNETKLPLINVYYNQMKGTPCRCVTDNELILKTISSELNPH